MRRPGDAVLAEPIQVELRDGESQERMIRRFTKKVKEDGIIGECIRKRHFVKRSDIRRRKRAQARYLAQRGS